MKELETAVGKMESKYAELVQAQNVLRTQVDALELKFSNFSVADTAHKRLSFLGFKSGSELDRIGCIRKFMSDHFADVSVQIGNIMKGPRNGRILTSVAYCEFSDSDVRNAVLSLIRSRNYKCVFQNQQIDIKPALSAVIRSRIWALNKAYELISASPLASKEVVSKVNEPSTRCIRVGVEVAFEQKSGSSDTGQFLGRFAQLTLPGKSSSSS